MIKLTPTQIAALKAALGSGKLSFLGFNYGDAHAIENRLAVADGAHVFGVRMLNSLKTLGLMNGSVARSFEITDAGREALAKAKEAAQ